LTPGEISRRVATDRLAWIAEMLEQIRELPLGDRDQFFADERDVWTAESCLRRALEALLDLGRHILAKGFGTAVTEYKEIAEQAQAHGILSAEAAGLLRVLAGYRNRLVHFYHEVEPEDLFNVCSDNLGDVEQLAQAYTDWLASHPEAIDDRL
jgi:uncharacterized protein YutE (UPF0331/DUF86 family)